VSDRSPILDLDTLLARAEWMRELARRLLHDPHRADDVVQQAFVAALERPPRDPARSDAWLRRVVRNLASMTRRGERRRRERERAVARRETGIPPAAADVAAMEMHRRLVEAVLALDEPYREAVVERFFHGRSPQEIARAKGIPSATVRSHLRRALERLRARLDDEDGRAAWLPLVAAVAGLRPEPAGATAPAAGAASAAASGTPAILAGAAAALVLLAAGAFVVLPFVLSRDPAPEPPALAGAPSGGEGAPPTGPDAPKRPATDPEPEATSTPEPVPSDPPAPVPAEAHRVLRVRAVDTAGEPAPGVRLEVRRQEGEWSPERDIRRHLGHFVTGDDGTGELSPILEGDYWIEEATSPFQLLGGDESWYLMEPGRVTVHERSGVTEAVVRVARPATLRGVVVDPSRGPIEGATFHYEWKSDAGVHRIGGGGPEATDPEGRFEVSMRILEGTSHTLLVDHALYDDRARVPFAAEPGAVVDLGVIELHELTGGGVRGRIDAPHLPRVRVAIDRVPPGERPRERQVGAGGPFDVLGLRPGPYHFRVDGVPDLEPIPFEVTEPGHVVDIGTIRIEPGEPRLVRGRVIAPDGGPAAGATVEIAAESVETGPDGRFELTAFGPGPHTVSVGYGEHSDTLYTRAEVPEDGSPLEIRLVRNWVLLRPLDARTHEPIAWTRAEVIADRASGGRDGNTWWLPDGPAAHDIRLNWYDEDRGRSEVFLFLDGYRTARFPFEFRAEHAEREEVVPVYLEAF